MTRTIPTAPRLSRRAFGNTMTRRAFGDTMTRRAFGVMLGAGAASLATPGLLRAQPTARLVIVGGGFGGASAARFAAIHYPEVAVTLIEPQTSFVTCPYGNLILGGKRELADITHSYDGLRARGVEVIHDRVAAIDAAGHAVALAGGGTLAYDKLILSPGIGLRWDAIEGYGPEAAEIFPHAWIGGDGSQITSLRARLRAMPQGGVFAMSIPENPFRCPPGPYERLSMVAHYLKQANPTAKILAFDAKEGFAKQGLFQDGWAELYGDMIEWVPASADGRIVRVDAANGLFVSEFGEEHRVDAGNVIPPQYAAAIAREAGLANDAGWVPVDPATFAAAAARDVHVIGDANVAGPMPKSGYIANSTAKTAVVAALAEVTGRDGWDDPVYFNTCYSHVGDDYGVSVVAIFRPEGDSFAAVPDSGGLSPRGPLSEQARNRRLEARYADAWYDSIVQDMFS